MNDFPLARQKKPKPTAKFNLLDSNMSLSDKKKLYEKITKLEE
jgi:hypothetical protein